MTIVPNPQTPRTRPKRERPELLIGRIVHQLTSLDLRLRGQNFEDREYISHHLNKLALMVNSIPILKYPTKGRRGGRPFFASTEELDKVVKDLKEWAKTGLEYRKFCCRVEGKLPPRSHKKKHNFLPNYTVVKVLAEAFPTYHDNHRIIWRDVINEPETSVTDPLTESDKLGNSFLIPDTRTYGPLYGIIIGTRFRQEGLRHSGCSATYDYEGESPSFDHMRTRPVYLVATNLFTEPIEVLTDDVQTIDSADAFEVGYQIEILQGLMNGTDKGAEVYAIQDDGEDRDPRGYGEIPMPGGTADDPDDLLDQNR